MLTIYNTLTGKKEPFQSIQPKHVRMYVCGVTVYDYCHIGHARSALVFDVIRRHLECSGYRVDFVKNFTDVDDKIIKRANEQGVSCDTITAKYIQAYYDDMGRLGVRPASIEPKATQHMADIVQLTETLIAKGLAYQVAGDVYFEVAKYPDYGRLSKRRLEDLQAGARVDIDERKRHPMDFALWKSSKPGEPSWPSPWGPGRPGWHIECSAMSMRHLGETFDIHGGGMDLIFPHHENEIAQTESYTGKPFARYWIHNGILQLGGEKMSKSLGNIVSIKEFLKKRDADVMRMLVLSGNYRAPLIFNEETQVAAEKSLERLKSAFRPASASAKGLSPEAASALTNQTETTHQSFTTAMDDDFNTPLALAALYELVKAINTARDNDATDDQLQPAQATLRELTGVLGLRLEEKQGTGDADKFIDLLVEVRNEVRQQKLWQLSDLIRNQLKELGVVIEDSKEGTKWRYS